jgi:hypothetical protein
MAGYASSALAETYVIDPAQSTIAVTGNVFYAPFSLNLPIVEQSPGSNIVTFNGSVDASVAGGNITITGANADADLQPLPQSPDIGGVTGTAPADAGLSIGPGLGDVALRDFVVSISGGPTPLTGGTDFDLTALSLLISGGTIDYAVPLASLVGSTTLVGTITSPTSGTGTLVGDVLTIPVDVSVSFVVDDAGTPDTADDSIATVFLNGSIVAAVPEPGTIAMLGVGLIGLVAVGRRRFRKV